ncbi:MAG: hypothetical protein ABI599_15170, partial [Flavobacteriales bacterium]
MKEDERTELIAIGHLSLRDWAAIRGITPVEGINVLKQLAQLVYSDRPALLDRALRSNYMAIQGMINVLGQLSLLQNRDVFALGQRCPERLRTYNRALIFTAELARTRYADADLLRQLDIIIDMHKEVLTEVNALYFRA